MKKSIVIICLCISAICFSQSRKDSLWIPFQKFAGEWNGTASGKPGNGNYERSYNFIFGKTFIEVKNKSVYPPAEKKPEGEIHEDIGYISYDRARKTFILRQFHIEGFVIQYGLDSISPDKKTIVFITESIENLPRGWKAKETYTFISDDEFIEVFELAPPNGNFGLYSKAILKRKQ